MDHTENTIVPSIKKIEDLPMRLKKVSVTADGRTIATFLVEYSLGLWRHIYEMYVGIDKGHYIRDSSTVREVIDDFRDIEIWYDGYDSRFLSILSAPIGCLAYTKGSRVTDLTE